jgi:hypothetical protein
LVIVDSNSAISSLEALAPWIGFFDYTMVPIVEIAEALPVLQRATNWRESVR